MKASSLKEHLAASFGERLPAILSFDQLNIFIASLNANSKLGDQECVDSLLRIDDFTKPDLVIVGFQEMVALSTTNVVGSAILGNQLTNETVERWQSMILSSLNSRFAESVGIDSLFGNSDGGQLLPYQLLSSCAMVGTVVLLFCKSRSIGMFKNVQTGSVARGIGNVLGNKGAVCVRFEVGETSICVVNAHLSAHRDGVLKRNEDYNGIITSKIFRFTDISDEIEKSFSTRPISDSSLLLVRKELVSLRQRVTQSIGSFSNMPAVDLQSTDTTAASYNNSSSVNNTDNSGEQAAQQNAVSTNGFASSTALVHSTMNDEKYYASVLSADDHDVIIWLGDLNYRLVEDIDIEEAYSMIDHMDIPELRSFDQLLLEKEKGTVFEGFKEGPLVFVPTYQYIAGTAQYDRREQGKQRCPAWCDRIMWRVGKGIKRIADSIKVDRARALEQYLKQNMSGSTEPSATASVIGFGSAVMQSVKNAYDVISSPFPIEVLQLQEKISGNSFVSEIAADSDTLSLTESRDTFSGHVESTQCYPASNADADDDDEDDDDRGLGETGGCRGGQDLRSTIGKADSSFYKDMALASVSDPMNAAQDIKKVIHYIQSEIAKESVDLLYYNSCSKVLLSDHLPVRALLQLRYKKIDWNERDESLSNAINRSSNQEDVAEVKEQTGASGATEAAAVALDALTAAASAASTAFSLVMTSSSWLTSPIASTLFSVPMASVSADSLATGSSSSSTNSGNTNNSTDSSNSFNAPTKAIGVINPTLPNALPVALNENDVLQRQLLYGLLSPLNIAPQYAVFSIVEYVGASSDGGQHDSYFADLTTASLKLTCGRLEQEVVEFQFLQESIPHWLSVSPMAGTLNSNTFVTLSVSLVHMEEAFAECNVNSPTQAICEASAFNEISSSSFNGIENEMISSGERLLSQADDEGDEAQDKDADTFDIDTIAQVDAASISRKGRNPSSKSLTRLSISLSATRLSSNKYASQQMSGWDSKLSQVLLASKLNGRYATGKDITDSCHPNIATSLALHYRVVPSRTASCADHLTAAPNGPDWKAMLIPIACSITKADVTTT